MKSSKLKFLSKLLVLTFSIFANSPLAHAWYDEAHLAVAKTAGYSKWYNAAGPDIAKLKAGKTEALNHYSNIAYDVIVKQDDVLAQVKLYNGTNDDKGHLYGAIIASVESYISKVNAGKYAEYDLAYAAHYCGDLSMPLHNVPYDTFNKQWHQQNEELVEFEVLSNLSMIEENMYSISLDQKNLEFDLAKHIARIANEARKIAVQTKKENRLMTKSEIYKQLGHSASLFRAILTLTKNIP